MRSLASTYSATHQKVGVSTACCISTVTTVTNPVPNAVSCLPRHSPNYTYSGPSPEGGRVDCVLHLYSATHLKVGVSTAYCISPGGMGASS
jgi:hypothetical protein